MTGFYTGLVVALGGSANNGATCQGFICIVEDFRPSTTSNEIFCFGPKLGQGGPVTNRASLNIFDKGLFVICHLAICDF